MQKTEIKLSIPVVLTKKVFPIITICIGIIAIAFILYSNTPHHETLAGLMRIETSTHKTTMEINPAKYRTWNAKVGKEIGYDLTIQNIDEEEHIYRLDISDLVNTSIKIYEKSGDNLVLLNTPVDIAMKGGEYRTLTIKATPYHDTTVRTSVGHLVNREYNTKFVSKWLIELKK